MFVAVAGGLAVALCASLLTVSPAAATLVASAPPGVKPKLNAAGLLPPPFSPKRAAVHTSLPAGRFVAGIAPSKLGAPAHQAVRELVDRRSARRQVWLNSDGTTSVKLFGTPRFFQPPGTSAWAPIDTTVAADPARAGFFKSAANAWTASFGALGAPGGMVQLSGPAGSFGFTAAGATAAGAPSSHGSEADYAALWPSVDVRYRVAPAALSEYLVLRAASAQTVFDFDLFGATARPDPKSGGLELVVGAQVVGVVPAPTVVTAAGPVVAATAGAHLAAVADSSGRPGGRVELSLSVAWLHSLAASAFPVGVDPTVSYLLTPAGAGGVPGARSFGSSGGYLASTAQTGVVTAGNPIQDWRALLHYDYESYLNAGPVPYQVESAFLEVADQNQCSTDPPPCSVAATEPLTVYGDPGSAASFSDVAALGTSPVAGTDDGGAVYLDVRPIVSQWFASNTPNQAFGLIGGDNGSPANPTSKIYYTSFGGVNDLDLTLDQPPAATTVISPANAAVVSTATPTLTAAPVTSNQTVMYDFQLATSPQGGGAIIDSGWVNANQWAVPPGSLEDAVTYYATVATADASAIGTVTPRPPGAPTVFAVNLRLGGGGPAPTDTVGSVPSGTSTPSAGAPSPGIPPASVTVNMVNGNLALTMGTHSLSSLSGPLAVSLSYNSLAQSSYGLLGQYYHDYDNHGFGPGDTLAGQRVDPAVNFNWPGGPIGGLPDGAPFLIRWSGFVNLPTAGSWEFGSTSGGGMRVYLDNGPAVADTWAGGQSTTAASYGNPAQLAAGVHQITVAAWSAGYGGVAQLWAQYLPAQGPPVAYVGLENWLTRQPQVLPAGWQLSANSYQAGYTSLRDQGSAVSVYLADGSALEFDARNGGYAPPPGHQELLTQTATGTFQLATPDNHLYSFSADGTVASITGIEDDLHPAALQYNYSGNPLSLHSIFDPVSGRSVYLVYGGESGCRSANAAPPGLLCAIGYWDGTQTGIFYDPAGRLTTVANPGGATASFGYDVAGRLTIILDPLGYDAVIDGIRTNNNNDALTEIAYTDPVGGQVQTVTSPAPATPSDARPERGYCYNSASAAFTANPSALTCGGAVTATTSVAIAGFNPASGHASQVSYDAQGRITNSVDPTGLATTTTWDNSDRPVVTVDPTGLQTTRAYSATGLLTDTYGPAPTACFDPTGHQPVEEPFAIPGCALAVPRAHTGYDQGIRGLAAAYWLNSSFAGPAVKHATGTGDPYSLYADYANFTTPPLSTAANWSARYSGTIDLGASGTYTFGADTRQAVAVYLDDQLAVSNRAPNPGQWAGTVTTAATFAQGLHRIRVDYQGVGGSGPGAYNGFAVAYAPPRNALSNISNSILDPGYGLATTTTDADNKTTATSYNDAANGIGPEYGIAAATTVDPAGLALTTTTAHEPPTATTYLRKTSATLPGGNTTTYSYYPGTGGPLAAVCGAGAAQGGQVMQRSDPAPGPGQAGRTTQYVYDPAGRQVGQRTSTADQIAATAWACTNYDLRGRIAAQSWPAHNGGQARTATHTYSVGGNPLTASVSDPNGTVSATVDLLGRASSYTDTWGQTTTTGYNQAGQATATIGPQGVIADSYDPNNAKLSTVAVDGSAAASVSYDRYGRLQVVNYPNHSYATVGYDRLGRAQALRWGGNYGIWVQAENLTKSPAGRTTADVVSTGSGYVNPNPAGGDDYLYDGAGRLVQSYQATRAETYSYQPTTPAGYNCPSAAAGANTNRTNIAYRPYDGSAVTNVEYCYNQADQLTKSVTSAGSTNAAYNYDDHGNTTNLAGVAYGWDSADRNTTINAPGTSFVIYTRDALDRVAARIDRTGRTQQRYSYSGHSDTPAATLDANNNIIDRLIALPGGVLLTKTPNPAGNTWSYPNAAGDLVRTSDDNGTAPALPVGYNPWGARDPNTAPVNNTNSANSYAAFGTAGRLEDHAAPIPTIQMGARPYIPDLGRFLTTEPGPRRMRQRVHLQLRRPHQPPRSQRHGGMSGLGRY